MFSIAMVVFYNFTSTAKDYQKCKLLFNLITEKFAFQTKMLSLYGLKWQKGHNSLQIIQENLFHKIYRVAWMFHNHWDDKWYDKNKKCEKG